MQAASFCPSRIRWGACSPCPLNPPTPQVFIGNDTEWPLNHHQQAHTHTLTHRNMLPWSGTGLDGAGSELLLGDLRSAGNNEGRVREGETCWVWWKERECCLELSGNPFQPVIKQPRPFHSPSLRSINVSSQTSSTHREGKMESLSSHVETKCYKVLLNTWSQSDRYWNEWNGSVIPRESGQPDLILAVRVCY